MKTRTQFIAVLMLFMMAVTVFPSEFIASGHTETTFTDGSEEETATFNGAGKDSNVTITLPHEARINSATMKLTGDQNNGEYLYHPTVQIDGTTLWDYNITGLGHLGGQQMFTDNSTSATLTFSGGDSKRTTLFLPKNATVTSATLDITGATGAGTMTNPIAVSEGSQVSSYGYNPSMASEGDHLYMVWSDDGDYEYHGLDQDIFFKRSSNNGESWTDPVVLSDSTMSSTVPTIAVDGDNIYVAWMEGELIDNIIYFRKSTDKGASWAKPVRIDAEGNYPNSPVLSTAGGYIYAVWDANGEIEFARSNDGDHWETQFLSSSSGSQIYSYAPWIASHGTDIYVVWYDSEEEAMLNHISFKHSDDSGSTFPDDPNRIDTAEERLFDPKVACNENGHVYAIWLRSGGSNNDNELFYARSVNDGTTWTGHSIIDDTDHSVYAASVSSEKESGMDYVYVAWEDRYNLSFIRSMDETTWGPSEVIIENYGYNPLVCANDDGHVYVGYVYDHLISGSYFADITINVSADRGSGWGDGIILSWELFDGNSNNPAIAVDNDRVYIVWSEQGNLSDHENGLDYDIFFRYNDGNSWSDIQVLSDMNNDGSSLNPAIAVDGSNVYVVWQEIEIGNTDDTDQDIMVKYSSNGGQSWALPAQYVSDDDMDGQSYYPQVAISGSTGYVVWRDDGDIAGSGTDYDICFRQIRNGMPQGNTMILSDDPNDSTSDFPDIAAVGNNVYAVWEETGNVQNSGSDRDVCYRQSGDGGGSWDDLMVISTTITNSYDPVISVGDKIYASWYETYPQFTSSDDGSEWSAQKRISSQSVSQIDITSYQQEVYVAYTYSSNVYILTSVDAGESWDDPVEITVAESGAATDPAIAYYDETLFACWDENSNLSGSGYDYDVIYRYSISSYPSNVELDVGNDGDVDWSYPGELDSTETYSGISFVNALNEAIEVASYATDTYGNRRAYIYLDVSSDTAGIVLLDNMMIEYDYTALVNNFSRALNDYLEAHQEEKDGDGNIEIPLDIFTDNAGALTLSDLLIDYDLQRVINITNPMDGRYYGSSLEIKWNSKNFEDGEQVVISYLEDGSWHVLDTVDHDAGRYNWADTSEKNDDDFQVKVELEGNSEVVDTTEDFMFDNYDPTTTHSYSYTGPYTDDHDDVWGRDVWITLRGNDNFQGGTPGSGVNHTYYSINEGEWMEYSEAFLIDTHGLNTFDYYSEDMIGNVEATKRGEALLDTVAPEISDWNVPSISYETQGAVTIEVQVSDDDTGIDEEEDLLNRLKYAFGEDGDPTKYQTWGDMENVEISDGTFSGEINENWLERTNEWGTVYLYISCNVADHVGNTAYTTTYEVVEADTIAPNIVEVSSRVGEDSDDIYSVGSEVRVQVSSDETGLTGTVYIFEGAVGSNFEAPLESDGTEYYALWNTSDINLRVYEVVFTIEDPAGNEVTNDSLLIIIRAVPYPDLTVAGILVEQLGVNAANDDIGEGLEANITITVRNSGTKAVPDVILTVYDDQKDEAHIIKIINLEIGESETKLVSVMWIPDAVVEKHTIYAVLGVVPGEKDDTNNEESVEVTVKKLPDLKVVSINFQDEAGKAITTANEGDKIKIVTVVENIGDAKAIFTVTAYHSGTSTIRSKDAISVDPGSTFMVKLDWPSAIPGDLTITIRVDPSDSVLEKDENNNDMSVQLKVEAGQSVTGETESDSEMPIFIPILLILIIGAVIGGGVYYLKSKEEEDTWDDGSSDSGASWDDEPAKPAKPVPPKPKATQITKEKPVEKAKEEKKKDVGKEEEPAKKKDAGKKEETPKKKDAEKKDEVPKKKDEVKKDDAKDTGKDKDEEAKDKTDKKADEKISGEKEKKPAPAAVKVKCPKCTTILKVSSDKRPLTVKCPKCETKLTIK